MYKHLSPFGNLSEIEIITTQINSSNNILEPLKVVKFSPDNKSPYYRYITDRLGLILPKLIRQQTKDSLFDLIISSKQSDPNLIKDITTIIQKIVDIDGYIDDEVFCAIAKYPILQN